MSDDIIAIKAENDDDEDAPQGQQTAAPIYLMISKETHLDNGIMNTFSSSQSAVITRRLRIKI